MEKGRIIRVVFTQGTTVTLPAPIGSRSSLDNAMHTVTMEYHPVGVRIIAPTMTKAVVVPYAQITSIDEALEVVQDQKRQPGRPKLQEFQS